MASGEFVKLVMAAAVLVLVGCGGGGGGGGNSSLAGRWVPEDGKSAPSGFFDKMELLKDGTGIVDDNAGITWKTEGNRIYITNPLGARVYNYKLSGGMLTLTKDDGKSAVYFTHKAKENREANAAKEFAAKIGASTFTDKRDGKKYKTVKIGGKTSMAENLNYDTGKSWCYEDKASNCDKYGRLYDWETANSVCPSGWHLPTSKEWDSLAAAVGGKRDSGNNKSGKTVYFWNPSGTKLKSSIGWYNNGNGTDDYGFSALPGGGRNPDGSFGNAGNNGFWWTATEYSSGGAYIRYMDDYNYSVGEDKYAKGIGSSVRCFKDDGKSAVYFTHKAKELAAKIGVGTFTDKRDGKKYKTVKIDGKKWMAENMNYDTGKSWCYEDKVSNCNKYGRLYDWETANSACPRGWHLPTSNEWDSLAAAVGGKRDSNNNKNGQTVYFWNPSGTKLKSSSGWYRNGNGTDDFGFSALPGGSRYTDGSFNFAGYYGGWWTATEGNSGYAYIRGMYYDNERVNEGNNDKSNGFSVRCLQD